MPSKPATRPAVQGESVTPWGKLHAARTAEVARANTAKHVAKAVANAKADTPMVAAFRAAVSNHGA